MTSWMKVPTIHQPPRYARPDLVHALELGRSTRVMTLRPVSSTAAASTSGEGEVRVLLDDEHRDAGFDAQAPDRAVHVFRGARRETERRLVEESSRGLAM